MQPALKRVALLAAADLEGRTDGEITEWLVDSLWHPPVVGDVSIDHPRPGRSHARPAPTPGVTRFVESRRLSLRWPVAGNAEWLEYWPDGADQGLTPVDRIMGELDLNNPIQKRDWNRLVELSTKRFILDKSAVVGFAEIPRDDPVPPGDAKAAVKAESDLLKQFVNAICRSAELHRDDLAARIKDAIRERRDTLSWERRLVEGLELRPTPDVLSVVDETSPDIHDGTVSLPSPRLDDPSVIALLRVIQAWAAKVEQYQDLSPSSQRTTFRIVSPSRWHWRSGWQSGRSSVARAGPISMYRSLRSGS